jgi:two-component system, NtrC family, sensor kinase
MADDQASGRPTLARELLWNLGLLTAAALSLAIATTLFVQTLAPRPALIALVGLILADIAVLYVFGRYLVRRHVLMPVGTLIAAADAIAQGDLGTRVPPADTEELHRLAERINEMTAALQDVQQQLVRAEKLAGIGRLSAGIAHEVGNPLGAIANFVALLRRRGIEPDVLADLEREVDRIDRIVRGLLAYARSDPANGEAGLVDAGEVGRRVLELLDEQGTTRGRDVRATIDPAIPPVRARAQGIEQVFVNLLLNALDASPNGAVGLLVHAATHSPGPPTEARRTDPPGGTPRRRPSRVPHRPELAAGTRGVLVVVTDTGTGIPEPDRERVFDPFVTTKPPGSGTGLGLAIVQRIVHESGGLVWVDDAREGGAALKVFLPAADLVGAAPAGPPAHRPADGTGRGAA